MCRTLRNGLKVIQPKQCSPFKDKLSGPEAKARAELLSGTEGWKFEYYRCPKCHTFHVGHAFPRERTTRK